MADCNLNCLCENGQPNLTFTQNNSLFVNNIQQNIIGKPQKLVLNYWKQPTKKYTPKKKIIKIKVKFN